MTRKPTTDESIVGSFRFPVFLRKFPFFKFFASCFIGANLFTVLFMNQPEVLARATNRFLDHNFSPRALYDTQSTGWRIKQYAHLLGLNNRWQMFGRQHRFNWHYRIKATYGEAPDSETILLPLPLQSERGIMQRHFFDNKQLKFHLHLYSSENGRECYSRYLARQHPYFLMKPVKRITWELHFQHILAPEEARRLRRHLDNRKYMQINTVVHCGDTEVKALQAVAIDPNP